MSVFFFEWMLETENLRTESVVFFGGDLGFKGLGDGASRWDMSSIKPGKQALRDEPPPHHWRLWPGSREDPSSSSAGSTVAPNENLPTKSPNQLIKTLSINHKRPFDLFPELGTHQPKRSRREDEVNEGLLIPSDWNSIQPSHLETYQPIKPLELETSIPKERKIRIQTLDYDGLVEVEKAFTGLPRVTSEIEIDFKRIIYELYVYISSGVMKVQTIEADLENQTRVMRYGFLMAEFVFREEWMLRRSGIETSDRLHSSVLQSMLWLQTVLIESLNPRSQALRPISEPLKETLKSLLFKPILKVKS